MEIYRLEYTVDLVGSGLKWLIQKNWESKIIDHFKF
jgi:hypothetical protein